MTRKHFNAIANVLRDNLRHCETEDELALYVIICRQLADALISFNSNFDRERFLKECGIEGY